MTLYSLANLYASSSRLDSYIASVLADGKVAGPIQTSSTSNSSCLKDPSLGYQTQR